MPRSVELLVQAEAGRCCCHFFFSIFASAVICVVFETASRRLGKLTDIINCTSTDYKQEEEEELEGRVGAAVEEEEVQ